MKRLQAIDGHWYVLDHPDEECCDCGLVHDIAYRIREGRLEARWTRNKKATRQARIERARQGRR